ncbi:response regulator [Amycolatopsis sp. CA-230715]|uniref:response regulator n=1 Tax=Amycolatopsis sp. CA-230715 TaxID=2745196 RepID=UPI001C00CB72|nr:response regulator transcription factor [Amycolatopsis sp. CA-230715]QWF78790.1 Transcriptional regulatory protein DegU [Amycolatopsis sp. CA-230715]
MRVAVAEDQFLLRDGLVRMLEAHRFDIVAAVGSGPEMLAVMTEQKPDVSLIDIRMPPTFTDEGLRIALQARQVHPGLPVLLLSQYVEQLYARELLEDGAGAVGYLLKDRVFNSQQFVTALHQVAAGGTVMDPDVVAKLLNRTSSDSTLDRLTDREREVLGLMAEGRSNAAIASALVVTEKAVAKHISSILTKLDLPPSTDDNRRVRAVLTYLGA